MEHEDLNEVCGGVGGCSDHYLRKPLADCHPVFIGLAFQHHRIFLLAVYHSRRLVPGHKRRISNDRRANLRDGAGNDLLQRHPGSRSEFFEEKERLAFPHQRSSAIWLYTYGSIVGRPSKQVLDCGLVSTIHSFLETAKSRKTLRERAAMTWRSSTFGDPYPHKTLDVVFARMLVSDQGVWRSTPAPGQRQNSQPNHKMLTPGIEGLRN